MTRPPPTQRGELSSSKHSGCDDKYQDGRAGRVPYISFLTFQYKTHSGHSAQDKKPCNVCLDLETGCGVSQG